MIRHAVTILVGLAFCFAAPLVAGVLIATAAKGDVVIVVMICAAAMSGVGMRWIFQDGQLAALRRFRRGVE